MLSTEERWLIAGVLALLFMGGIVMLCRNKVQETDVEKLHLPSLTPAKAPGALKR